MRFSNPTLINAITNAGTVNSVAVPTQFETSGSFQISFTDSGAAGTFVVQASNDPGLTPVNWNTIPNTSTSITAGATTLVTVAILNYRWIRAQFIHSAGAGTFTVNGFMFGF